jgi:hypothetical protein
MSQPLPEGKRPNVFFYFFDKLQPTTCRTQVAFQSILSQILDFCEKDKNSIDLASLALYKHHGGSFVSQEEVMFATEMLLQKIDGCYLVFDGVDECINSCDFFQSLNNIASTAGNSKIALFSRPDIRVPKSIVARASRIFLRSSQNTGDIQSYALQRILELTDEQVLPTNRDTTEVAFEIATRADGMFLWAYLLIEYLQCEGLSAQERIEALEEMVVLEGLEKLYAIILEKMSRNPPKARANVRRAFQWTAGTLRPLTIQELSIAATSFPRKSTPGPDEIPNLEQTLGSFSGSLLESNPDGTVRFVHSSVKEYLQSAGAMLNMTKAAQEFGIIQASTLLYLARTCIAYIETQIPTGPLSGSSQVTPSKHLIAGKYPFLDYCLKHWQNHVCIFMDLARSRTSCFGQVHRDGTLSDLLVELTTFIHNRKRVTTWIECSWLFDVPPNVAKVASATDALQSTGGSVTDRSTLLEDLAANVRLLARDLGDLSSAWGQTLSITPNEIWEPSLSAFTPSKFLVGTQDCKVTRFTVSHGPGLFSTLVQTRSSEDGLEIGVVKLLIPR